MQSVESAVTLVSRSAVIVTKSEYTDKTVYAGGIFGYAAETLKLQECFAEGNIVVSSRYGYVGGLVGYFEEYSNILTNCYATGDVSGSNGVGGLVGRFGSNLNTLTNCYATGDVTGNGNAGGLVGGLQDGENTIQNSYSTSKITYTGAAQTAYLGGLVGYAQEVTLTNAHWLYFADSGIEYAVGYSATLSIPTNIGATKHTDIAEFYDLADTLNKGQETPAWEHAGANTLPALIHE